MNKDNQSYILMIVFTIIFLVVLIFGYIFLDRERIFYNGVYIAKTPFKDEFGHETYQLIRFYLNGDVGIYRIGKKYEEKDLTELVQIDKPYSTTIYKNKEKISFNIKDKTTDITFNGIIKGKELKMEIHYNMLGTSRKTMLQFVELDI